MYSRLLHVIYNRTLAPVEASPRQTIDNTWMDLFSVASVKVIVSQI